MENFEIERLIEEIAEEFSLGFDNLGEELKSSLLNKIDSILAQEPNNTDALFWKGMYYESLCDYEKAINIYDYLLQIDPNSDTSEIVKDSLKTCISLKNTSGKSAEHYSYQNKNSSFMQKISCHYILIIKVIVIIFIFVAYFSSPLMSLILSSNDNRILKINDTKNFKQLKVNPPFEYNFLSKKEIYDIRKKFVKNSIFATPEYEPSSKIFNQIVDGKPWWNTSPCCILNYKGDYHERIEGESHVSIQVNNPNALVGAGLPYSPWAYDSNREFCEGEYGKFIPYSIKYSKKDNLIILTYKLSKYFLNYRININGRKYPYLIQLSGLNALDFGYPYVFAFYSKNITMYDRNTNITTDVKLFRDFIHLGHSCKYAGGCNNISPLQQDMTFYINNLPAEINLKLWKKRPADKDKKADFYYKIIFEI